MKILFFILTDIEKLPSLVNEFSEEGINWTIFDTNTMDGDILSRHDVFDMMFGSLRKLKPDLKNSKTMMTIIKNDGAAKIVESIEKIMGNLDTAGGVVFTINLDYIKGY